ncbi:MAG: hypothetical protein M1818_004851 [Claussenomyces sp. TS43310]|nr:MAG: hypothetical protein M1818_004851 [Claussenomyces sp. TS43310]
MAQRFLEIWDIEVGSRLKHFNKGVKTVAGNFWTSRPCDQWFLDTMVNDLQNLKNSLFLIDPIYESLNDKISDERQHVVEHIMNIMKECHRLHKAPELFPSDASRESFLTKIGFISAQLSRFADFKSHVAAYEEKGRKCIPDEVQPILAKRVGKVWFRVPEPPKPKLPDLHPYSTCHKKLWNKWLDNYDVPTSEGAPHFRIVQRVPLVGIKLLRRQRFMYGVVRKSYVMAHRVIRTKKREGELSEATGEDYGSLFQSTNMQLRMRLGFETGSRKSYDVDGVMTLEHLSKFLRGFQKRRFAPATDIYHVCTVTKF